VTLPLDDLAGAWIDDRLSVRPSAVDRLHPLNGCCIARPWDRHFRQCVTLRFPEPNRRWKAWSHQRAPSMRADRIGSGAPRST